jgi:hypothetical protein
MTSPAALSRHARLAAAQIPPSVPRAAPRLYDETIRVMKAAVQKAKLGREDMLAALKRLDGEARRVESHAAGPPVED